MNPTLDSNYRWHLRNARIWPHQHPDELPDQWGDHVKQLHIALLYEADDYRDGARVYAAEHPGEEGEGCEHCWFLNKAAELRGLVGADVYTVEMPVGVR